MKITYLGHSAFEIITNNSKLLIDPFLVLYPEYEAKGVTDIFVTHGHGDHLGSAIEISKTNKATITAVFELANYCSKYTPYTNSVGLGAWLKFPFGKVIFLPAFHSSSLQDGSYAGCPAGILFEIEGIRIFHAGDTSLNSEMKVLKEVFKPEIAMLPIGGTYTMDIEQAAIAAEWIDAKTFIPMHYNTFEPINTDVQAFVKKVESQGRNVRVLSVGESL